MYFKFFMRIITFILLISLFGSGLHSQREVQSPSGSKKSTNSNLQRVSNSNVKRENISSAKGNQTSASRNIETSGRQVSNVDSQGEPLGEISWKQLENLSKPFVQEKNNGSINWTEQYIEAKGEAVIDNERFKNPSQAKLMARRGAVVVAQRNLLEIIKGVNITSETTVEDLMATKDFIYTRIDGTIKGAKMVGEPIEKDGVIEVRLRVPLYEAQNSLGAAVYDGISLPQNTTIGSNPQQEVLMGGDPKSQRVGGSEGHQDASASWSGKLSDYNPFIFNIQNAKDFNPAMFPVIVDENGKVVLDFSKIYDPSKGKFPKLLGLTREALEATGWKKGMEVVDLIAAGNGKLQLAPGQKSKFNWQKVLNTVSDIGRFILRLL